MAHNPLLGSRISLISKKNIRYEGTLYSINEKEATVALQNVRAFGTEGREKNDNNESTTFVPPQDAVHPYLLFRGCDIKDLHVHEGVPTTKPPTDPAILSTTAPINENLIPDKKSVNCCDNINGETVMMKGQKKPTYKKGSRAGDKIKESKNENEIKINKTDIIAQSTITKKIPKVKQSCGKRTKKNGLNQMVGSGECLLNRKARGAVGGLVDSNVVMMNDFDFETNLAAFDKVDTTKNKSDKIEKNASIEHGRDKIVSIGSTSVYHKNEFFDSISCDVLDKQNGIDNRLRGSDERNLNTETFGAVSLGNRRRGGRKNKRGYGGRSRGRGGRYGGVARYNDGTRPRENNRWSRESIDILGSNKTIMCHIDSKGTSTNHRTWANYHQ